MMLTRIYQLIKFVFNIYAVYTAKYNTILKNFTNLKKALTFVLIRCIYDPVYGSITSSTLHERKIVRIIVVSLSVLL